MLPEHICTVLWRYVKQNDWLLFCKWNLADTQKPCGTCVVFYSNMDANAALNHKKKKLKRWKMSISIPAVMVSVKLQRCPRIFTRYLSAALQDKEPVFCSSGRLRYGGGSVVDHTHCKSHLQSYWVMAIFCCPGAFHTPDDHTQLYQQLLSLCSYLSTQLSC